jgi:hypothetical protein
MSHSPSHLPPPDELDRFLSPLAENHRPGEKATHASLNRVPPTRRHSTACQAWPLRKFPFDGPSQAKEAFQFSLLAPIVQLELCGSFPTSIRRCARTASGDPLLP